MSIDLGEFRSAYLTEAEELVASSNRHLLALEASLRKGEQNARAVRELFRAMHTLKGLSAMVGVEPIVVISHHVETALREASRHGGRIRLPAIELMLRGVREIESRLRAVASDLEVPPPPRELSEALEALEVVAPVAVESSAELSLDAEIAGKLNEGDREQLLQGVASGRRAVQIDFAPGPERAREGVNITTVRERVGALGDIVKVVPQARPVSEAAPGGLLFALLVVTSSDDATLATAASVEPSAVRVLAEGSVPEVPLLVEDHFEDAPDAKVSGGSTLRVEVARLEETMERLAALIVGRFRFTAAVAKLGEAGADVRPLRELLRENGRQLRELRTSILHMRMVPLVEVLDRIPLLVRGLARDTGRVVALTLDVGKAEVDKTIAERIFPAIVHLVRNAVDHGIEPSDERVASGKTPEGHLRISATERANAQLEIIVSDDGRGVNGARVAERAGREVPRTPADLLDLLCVPGLSTRSEATTTSGRGLGMDIVRRSLVDQLGGDLRIETEVGRGTQFHLRVPLTISIVDAFTFTVLGERYCVPVTSVEEILDVEHARLVHGPGTQGDGVALGMLERRGETLPLVGLGRVLGRGGEPGKKAFVVRRNGEVVAFAVDTLLGQQEVVVRPLEDPLVAVRGVTGATDLGDGRPTLVLDLYGLLNAGRSAAEAA